MTPPTLTVTLGLPGSGKSTWAAKNPRGALLSLDAIRRGASANDVVGRTHRQAEAFLRKGQSVCIDACSLRADHRWRWLTMARRHGATTELVVLQTPFVTCRRRDAARPPAERAKIDWALASRNLELSLTAIQREGWGRITWVKGS